MQSEGGGRFAEFLLLGTGLLQFLTGAALIVVPSALPQYAWIVHSLARRGITGLPLYVGGVVLSGLWLSTRSNRARSASVRESAISAATTIEKLAAEVGHLGDGLQGLRIEFVYLKDALQSQLENVQASSKSENPADAMFRMAASLDQVGARIEERLNSSHRELGQALQSVSTAVESIKVLTVAPPIQYVEVEERPEAPAHPVERVHPNSVGSEMDREQAVDAWDHDASDRHNHLGLLDMLDDLGRILPRRTSPAIDRPNVQNHVPPSIQTDPFEEVQDEGWEHAASIPGPMPAARGDELRLAKAGDLLGSGSSSSLDDAPLGDKLAELRDLLADVRVREALASIERSRK